MLARIIMALFLLFLSSLGFAANDATAADLPEPLQKLMQQDRRPTILEFENALLESFHGNLPPSNVFGSSRSYRPAHFQDYVKLIVESEMITPGATYYVMGRDAGFYGDALQYFFEKTLGQSGRVRLLDVSNPSFANLAREVGMGTEEYHQTLAKFLKTAGIDVTVPQEYPQVLTDVTSFRPTSQTTQLMRALFTEANRAGISPQETLQRIGFLGVYLGSSDPLPENIRQVQQLEAQQLKIFNQNGQEAYRPVYLRTNLAYGAAWHEMFDGFMKTEKGVEARPPPQFAESRVESERMSLFAEMYQALQIMNDPQFLPAVQNLARAKGFEFPMTRITRLAHVEIPVPKPAPERVAGIKSEKLSSPMEADPVQPVARTSTPKPAPRKNIFQMVTDFFFGSAQSQPPSEKAQAFPDSRVEAIWQMAHQDIDSTDSGSSRRQDRLAFWNDDINGMKKNGSLSESQAGELIGRLQGYAGSKPVVVSCRAIYR